MQSHEPSAQLFITNLSIVLRLRSAKGVGLKLAQAAQQTPQHDEDTFAGPFLLWPISRARQERPPNPRSLCVRANSDAATFPVLRI